MVKRGLKKNLLILGAIIVIVIIAISVSYNSNTNNFSESKNNENEGKLNSLLAASPSPTGSANCQNPTLTQGQMCVNTLGNTIGVCELCSKCDKKPGQLPGDKRRYCLQRSPGPDKNKCDSFCIGNIPFDLASGKAAMCVQPKTSTDPNAITCKEYCLNEHGCKTCQTCVVDPTYKPTGSFKKCENMNNAQDVATHFPKNNPGCTYGYQNGNSVPGKNFICKAGACVQVSPTPTPSPSPTSTPTPYPTYYPTPSPTTTYTSYP